MFSFFCFRNKKREISVFDIFFQNATASFDKTLGKVPESIGGE